MPIPPARSSAAEATSLAGRRVLIAEDEPLIAMEMQALVEDLAGEVVALVGAVGRIAPAVEEFAPDLVFLDVNMRGVMSYDAALALRGGGIALVFVTAYDSLPNCPAELASVPRLQKPVSLSRLSRVLALLPPRAT